MVIDINIINKKFLCGIFNLKCVLPDIKYNINIAINIDIILSGVKITSVNNIDEKINMNSH